MSATGGSDAEGKGVVEIALRAVVAVIAVGAIIAAAVCVGTLNDAFGSGNTSLDLFNETRGATGWIIFVAIAAIVIMALFIILRIVARGSAIILAVGIVFSGLLGLGYFVGGVAAAVFTRDWDDLFSAGTNSEGDRIRASLGAAAALCFLSDVLLVVLVIVSIMKK